MSDAFSDANIGRSFVGTGTPEFQALQAENAKLRAETESLKAEILALKAKVHELMSWSR